MKRSRNMKKNIRMKKEDEEEEEEEYIKQIPLPIVSQDRAIHSRPV